MLDEHILARTIDALDADFADRPLIDARVLGDAHPHVGASHQHLAYLAVSRGRTDEALEHPARAVDLGWIDRSVLTDAEWVPLRDDSRFRAVVARLEPSTVERRSSPD